MRCEVSTLDGGREGVRAENGERWSKVTRGAVGVGVVVVVVMAVVATMVVEFVVVIVVVAVAVVLLMLVLLVVVLVAVSGGFFHRVPGYSRSPLSVYFVLVYTVSMRESLAISGVNVLFKATDPPKQQS